MPATNSTPGAALLMIAQAAEYLGLCERTLWYRTAPRGPIPCVRIGRSVRYDRRDLDEYIESSKDRGEGSGEWPASV